MTMNLPTANACFHGLRMVLYHARDLDKAKAWSSRVLGLMRSHRVTIFLVGFLSACLLGCVTDISHDSRYRTDYVVDGIYRVKKSLFVDRGERSMFGTWDCRIFTLPGSRFARIPDDVAQYERERGQRWRNIAGVVAAGTRIRVTKIKLERNPEMGKAIWIEGVILDGDLAGMKGVELSFISPKRRDQQTLVPMVNDEILERVLEP